jgi:hypothetical protein
MNLVKVMIDEEDYFPIYNAYTSEDFNGFNSLETLEGSIGTYVVQAPADLVARWREVRESWKVAQKEMSEYVRASDQYRDESELDCEYS